MNIAGNRHNKTSNKLDGKAIFWNNQ